MRRKATALVAALLAALLLGDASGVARAVEYDAIVHCCCGDHDEAHRCHCARCPGAGRLRVVPSRRTREPAPEHASFDDCHGRSRALPTVASVPSLTPPPPPRLPLPDGAPPVRPLAPLPLHDRALAAVRPPP